MYVPGTELINDSYQKISDDRLTKCIDYSGMIINSFRRLGFIPSDSFFLISVPALFYIMPFREYKSCTRNHLYRSLSFCQIGQRNFSSFLFLFFLQTFRFPRFLTMFPCSDIFEILCAHSLDYYVLRKIGLVPITDL